MLTINHYLLFSDLVFLENPDVIFRVALALLSHHKDAILACESFEEIMNYLKNTLPNIDKDKRVLEKVMKQVNKFSNHVTN